MACDHKFIDSKHCLKCGWTPGEKFNDNCMACGQRYCFNCTMCDRHQRGDGLCCTCRYQMEKEGGKVTSEEMIELLNAPGLNRYAELMATKFGGSADQYKPYLLAVSMEVGFVLVDEALRMVRDGRSLAAGLIEAKMCNVLFAEAVHAAAEAVGIDWEARSAGVLGDPLDATEISNER